VVASARRGDRELATVVLGGGEDPQRFVEAARLLDHGFDAFETAEVVASYRLAVAGGAVTLGTPQTRLIVPRGRGATIVLPLPAWIPEVDIPAVVEVAGDPVGEVLATLDGSLPAPVDGDAAVGRALADAAYGALRAGVGRGRLPVTLVR
jgi:D-alanyl-D-alanine carboxypeptidase